MLVNVTVEVPNDPAALALEPLCSLFVVRLTTSMGITVQLNNKFAFCTEVIGDVVPDRMLSAELEAVQPSVPEAPPHFLFSGSGRLTHLLGEFEVFWSDSMGS